MAYTQAEVQAALDDMEKKGLVEKLSNGNYRLTELGRVVREAQEDE